MNKALSDPTETATAPQAFRDAMAELVQIGLKVARMVGQVSDAEAALAEAAAKASVAAGVSSAATSLAEAIESDRAFAAAAEARHNVVARARSVAAAFADVSRGIRLTVMLAERLDRGWARGGVAGDRPAITRPPVVREVAEAAARAADAERPERLDREDDLSDRPVAEIIAEICRCLRLDPVRMTIRSPAPDTISQADMDAAIPLTKDGQGWRAPPPQRRPEAERGRATPVRTPVPPH